MGHRQLAANGVPASAEVAGYRDEWVLLDGNFTYLDAELAQIALMMDSHFSGTTFANGRNIASWTTEVFAQAIQPDHDHLPHADPTPRKAQLKIENRAAGGACLYKEASGQRVFLHPRAAALVSQLINSSICRLGETRRKSAVGKPQKQRAELKKKASEPLVRSEAEIQSPPLNEKRNI
jgi:hypothetical protein